MKIVSFISSILLLLTTFGFLYLGNVVPDFHANVLSKILGLSFEISLILSTILCSIVFVKSKKFIHLMLILIPFFLFVIHLILIMSTGFLKAFSYGMDVVISILYLVILARDFEFFTGKKL